MLTPLILGLLIALALLTLLIIGLTQLSVRIRSKRLKAVRKAKREFLRSRVLVANGPIRISDSASSRKDLRAWDFAYQSNRWIAENQDLIASAKRAHASNLELYSRIEAALQKQLDELKPLGFPLRRIELRKVNRLLRQMSWTKEIRLHLRANYTSPAGRVNIDNHHVHVYSLDSDDSALSASDTVAKETIFDDPQRLQFPGVYVYTYPSLMGNDRFPLKIGKSESSVYARVRQQIAQGGAAIPEDPVVICAIRFDQGAGIAEATLHASFRKHRTTGGGVEWFVISLSELRTELKARGYSSTWNRRYLPPDAV